MFYYVYYAIMAVRHTHTNTQIHPLERHKKIFKKTVINKAINRETRRAAAGRRSGR